MVKTKKIVLSEDKGSNWSWPHPSGSLQSGWVEAGQTGEIFEVNQNGFLFSDPQKNDGFVQKKPLGELTLHVCSFLDMQLSEQGQAVLAVKRHNRWRWFETCLNMSESYVVHKKWKTYWIQLILGCHRQKTKIVKFSRSHQWPTSAKWRREMIQATEAPWEIAGLDAKRWWWYCWWKKSCTTWDVKSPVNNVINYFATGARFLPSTVWCVYVLKKKAEKIWFTKAKFMNSKNALVTFWTLLPHYSPSPLGIFCHHHPLTMNSTLVRWNYPKFAGTKHRPHQQDWDNFGCKKVGKKNLEETPTDPCNIP